jgi:hypothetical protein
MKKIIIAILALLIATPALFAQTKAGKKDTTQHATLYACPMHADVVGNQPGKCPKCGMDLSLSAKEQMKVEVTKNYTCPSHVAVTSHDPGKCPQCGKKLRLSPKEQMKAEVMRTNTCPMHPQVALDKDGKCPKCTVVPTEKKQD